MPSFLFPMNQTESELQKKERIFVEDSAPTDAELHGEWKLADEPGLSQDQNQLCSDRCRETTSTTFYKSKNPHQFVQNDQDEFFAYAILRPQESTQANYAAVQRRKLVAHRAYWGESLIPYGRENTTSESKNGPTTRAWQMGSSCQSHAKKIGLKPKAKSQWDSFHPVGWNYFIGTRSAFIAKLIPGRILNFLSKNG